MPLPPTPDSFDKVDEKIPDFDKALSWRCAAARRRSEILAKIPEDYLVNISLLNSKDHRNLVRESGILTERELSIIHSTATELLRCIHTREYTAVEVTTAFCKSAAIAHQATNSVAWVLFDEALASAAELDSYMQTHGKPKGPLHGLPISVKEHIFLAGTPATSGMVAWADDYSDNDALIVKVFRDAGAVFHVKTTNPQALMALETESNLYGTTTNPYNTNLTPGGSSGGESALIAMRGSVLGIGTDIGGSIRVPAAFCGLYGLKPSVARLPHGGLSGLHAGMENVVGAVGPLAHTIEDLRLFCKMALASEPWLYEPPLIELPWKSSQKIQKSLRIGVMYHDATVIPHPPITRCLQQTVRALQAAGHTIIDWQPTLHPSITNCVNKLYFLDGGKEFYDTFEAGNEPASPLMKWLLETEATKSYHSSDSWMVNRLRNKLQEEYASQWNSAGIDVLLCPANASVASAHRESTYWGYSSAFNLLDYSAAVFPVGKVEQGDSWEAFPRPGEGFLSVQDKIYRGYYGDDGPEKYEGAPVCLQLVTRRLREERLLDMLERVVEDIEEFGN